MTLILPLRPKGVVKSEDIVVFDILMKLKNGIDSLRAFFSFP